MGFFLEGCGLIGGLARLHNGPCPSAAAGAADLCGGTKGPFGGALKTGCGPRAPHDAWDGHTHDELPQRQAGRVEHAMRHWHVNGGTGRRSSAVMAVPTRQATIPSKATVVAGT